MVLKEEAVEEDVLAIIRQSSRHNKYFLPLFRLAPTQMNRYLKFLYKYNQYIAVLK